MAVDDDVVDMDQLAERLSNRALAGCGDRQVKRLNDLKVDMVKRGTLGSGIEEHGKLTIAIQFIDEYAERTMRDLLELVRKAHGTIPKEHATWIRQRLEHDLDLLKTGQAGCYVISTFGQRSLGDYIQRKKAGLSSALEIEVQTARLEAQKKADAADFDDMIPQLKKKAAFNRDLKEAARQGHSLALVMIDGDGLKRVNDQHGHNVGDEVIRGLGALIAEGVKGNGEAYRFGGDEFALLLPQHSPEEANTLAEGLRVAIAAATFSDKLIKLTASLGVAHLPDHASDGDGLLHEADQALLRAKKLGRNRVECAQSGARGVAPRMV